MPTADLDLARRLAAHPAFAWRRGMVADAGEHGRWMRTPTASWQGADGPGFWAGHELPFPYWPDLADDGNAGVLLGSLGPRLFGVTRYFNGRIAVGYWVGRAVYEASGMTLGEAAARAWLAANEGAVGAVENQ